ncbi:MAG: hypothetical protein NC548_62955 [Lachnospiraceae bacterium]|nr:hypothetical protein [Lachnospiraceae bacterium]
MAYIKFRDSSAVIAVDVVPDGKNVATLKFYNSVVVDTSGFHVYLDEKGEYDIGGKTYEKFTTIYRNDETTAEYNGYQLSNDGSVCNSPAPTITFSTNGNGSLSGDLKQSVEKYEDLIVPVPIPDENYAFAEWIPEIPKIGKITKSENYTAIFTWVETLDEIKAQKIAEMNAEQQTIIQNGVEVTLSDGTTERFTLKDQDQMSLMGLQTLAMQGADKIPWHEANNAEHCKYYSAEDMNRITSAAMSFISYHVTLFRDLRIYINSMEDKESVQAATYGMYIPSEYQSEVLADFYSAQNV